MIGEILAQHTWLWPAVWQSTAVLALGLGASFLLRRRAVRAHQLLLLALIAAIAVPLLSHLVKQHQWGLLRARPKAIESNARPIFAIERLSNSERAAAPRTMNAMTAATQGPATTHTPSVVPIRWKQLVVPLWIVLSAALLVRLALRFLLGYRLARRSVPCDAQEIAIAIERAKTRLGIDSDVQVRRSAETHSPVIWCWGLRPILLVPQETQASDNIDWPSVVCHELAHWKRRDHLSGLWAEQLVCLLPWNPLSWLAQRKLVRLSEEACDDWVIASGQVGTRYARTLLGLTPQGRAALVPAVVSSRKGLATRIRRILTDQCASPHSGRRWSLATAALAASLAVTIAFAQAGPTQPTGTIQTKLPHGAVIEQLAPATTIKGIVLDPNGNPTSDVYIVAPPMTVYGAEVRDEDGRFELPWSPAWFEEGQPRHLLAMKLGDMYDEHEAAFATITDPTAPMTIRLEPAFALEAKVVDPNRQPIPGYSATLSLATEYSCRAPVWATDAAPPRVRLFSSIPFGPKYTLAIEAKGYRTKQVPFDGADRSRNVIDLGEITLEPQDSTSTSAVMPNAKLQKAFLELYRLNGKEVLKLVKPPFVLGRQEWLSELSRWTEFPIGYGNGMNLRFGWSTKLQHPLYGFSGPTNLSGILRLMLVIPKHDFNLPKEFNVRLPGGDWIVRTGSPLEDQMEALEEIILAETGRSIRFEKRRTEREVVVARGRYQLTSHPNGKQPNHVHLSWDGTVGERHEQADSLTEMFKRLERDIAMKIVDETEFIPETTIPYVATNNLAWIGDFADVKRDHLNDLLDNLAKTTSLQFTVEKRPADVWFVTEEAK